MFVNLLIFAPSRFRPDSLTPASIFAIIGTLGDELLLIILDVNFSTGINLFAIGRESSPGSKEILLRSIPFRTIKISFLNFLRMGCVGDIEIISVQQS